jgi:hypothetical protein
MIIFNYTILDQFLEALSRRASNEIFSSYFEPNQSIEIADNRHKLILQFLGYPNSNNTNLIVLHQCILKMKTKNEREVVIQNLQKAFKESGDVMLIQGSINEIFTSIS